jgi:hypothetical protein
MFALSTLGGAPVPWLVGFAGFESLRSGLVIPVTGSLLMLAILTPPWSGEPCNSSYGLTCQQR